MRVWLMIGLVVWLLALPAAATAEETPGQHFTTSLRELRTALKVFSETVDTYNHSLKEVTAFDVDAARAEVAEIKGQVKHLIDQISYGSDLARSQDELSRWIDRNWRLVRADPLLSSERKAFLEQQWSQRADEIAKASKEISAIRKDLTDQLNRIIGDETFLTQLVFLEKAGEASALVRQFLKDIKSFSDDLKRRLDQMPMTAPAS